MKRPQLITAILAALTASSFAQTSFVIDFEHDDQGNQLIAGSVDLAANEPYRNLFGKGSGVQLSTNNPENMPLNLYNTEGTGGADDDLERNSTGSGLWAGGSDLKLLVNNALIINTDTNLATPNDDGMGGDMILNFDVALNSFGFDFIDLDSAANGSITFLDSSSGTSRTVSFADFEDTPDARLARTGVAFGDRHANRVLNIGANELRMSSFDQVTFSLLSSGGIGTIYGTTVTPVPEPTAPSILLGGLALLVLIRRR
ncbi:MAG: hypothetical protein ACSHX9_05485 [Luteolibacter sp.]